MIVSPGRIAPRRSASLIIESAVRSLIDPVGLWLSSLARMRTSGLGEMWLSWTSGVLPIVAGRSARDRRGRWREAGRAPPAIAGRISSVSPSATAVSSQPSRSRTSSSLR